jgi:hypothetical protein
VRASGRLTGEQKTALRTRLQAAEDALTALRAKVAAATTVDQVRAALQQSGLRGFLGRGWNHGWRGRTWASWDETQGDADSRDKAGTAKTHRASAAGATRDDDRERARHVRGDRDGDRRAAGRHHGDHRWSSRR